MADEDAELSILDRPEILGMIFYPRRSWARPLAPNSKNYFIDVEKGVRIECRFHERGKSFPSMLYFHGNGTIVDDMDLFAPLFNTVVEVNLFVAGYRGYGMSNGTPTLIGMRRDSHRIFEGFKDVVKSLDFEESFFVMGRSLGSISAIELACSYPDDIRGLIIESGPSNALREYLVSLVPSNHPIWRDDWGFLSKVRLRSVLTPTLIIHGEHDSLVPLKQGRELYENSAAKDKRLVIIPNADHNDLFIVGKEQYYGAIRKFVKDYGYNTSS